MADDFCRSDTINIGQEHKRCNRSQSPDHNQFGISPDDNSCSEFSPSQQENISNNQENFFSTQFVHADENGNMALAGNSWLLAAISIPLTIITIALWWVWVRYANMMRPPAPELAPVVKVVRYNSFRSLRSSRREQRASDVESGTVSGTATWSSQTTTKSQ